VPLSELQAAILRLLASHRSPESYVAGAAAGAAGLDTMEGLVPHAGARRGLWPSSPEIGSAMLHGDGLG